MLLSLYIYFLYSCFRHIQTYSSIIQEHTHAYSEACVSVAYSKPWHVLITKHIQTPRYIYNTILNIFTKAPSWEFGSYECASLLKMLHITVSLNIIFQTCSGMFKIFSAIFIVVMTH